MEDQAEKLREIMRNRGDSSDIALADQELKNKTRIIAVSSGKGGVGKTNLSINIAIAYAQLGKKVIIMDFDLGLANVNIIMGLIPKFNLSHVIRNQKSIKDVMMDTKYGVKLVAGASGFSKIANLSEDERQFFIREIASLEQADIIILDTSAGVSHNVLSFLQAADDVLIVTTPEPTAITDAYGIIKILATEVENPDISIKLIVNRVQSVTQGKKVSERLIKIAGQFLNLKIDYLGFVYEDPLVQSSVLKQMPFIAADSKSKASLCVKHLVSRLENIEYKEGGGFGKFLQKLWAGQKK